MAWYSFLKLKRFLVRKMKVWIIARNISGDWFHLCPFVSSWSTASAFLQPHLVSKLIVEDVSPNTTRTAFSTSFPKFLAAMKNLHFDNDMTLATMRKFAHEQLAEAFPVRPVITHKTQISLINATKTFCYSGGSGGGGSTPGICLLVSLKYLFRDPAPPSKNFWIRHCVIFPRWNEHT